MNGLTVFQRIHNFHYPEEGFEMIHDSLYIMHVSNSPCFPPLACRSATVFEILDAHDFIEATEEGGLHPRAEGGTHYHEMWLSSAVTEFISTLQISQHRHAMAARATQASGDVLGRHLVLYLHKTSNFLHF